MLPADSTLVRHSAIVAFFFAVALTVPLMITFGPSWETNDDVAMSMVAHGYGIAAFGSPNLVFSNVLWGHIVRQIPPIQGVLGYSTASLGVVLAAAWAILYFLIRLGTGYVVALLVTFLIIARPTLFPQFTINAGLLTVAAIAGWRADQRHPDLFGLLIACSCAYIGFLIRSLEFLLLLIVAAPLLPWESLYVSRRFRASILLLSGAIALSVAFDYWSYQAPAWEAFSALNKVRSAYTDFGAAHPLMQSPDILSRFNYSQNDLMLLKNWFFADAAIANPQALREMLAALGPMPVLIGNLSLSVETARALLNRELLPGLAAALATLFLVAQRRPIWLGWGIFALELLVMGMVGRLGVSRVYVPIVTLLLIAPLLAGQLSNWRRRAVASIILATNVVSSSLLLSEARVSNQLMDQALHDIQVLDKRRYHVIWGGTFPFEYAFPVLAGRDDVRNLSLYGLGVFTLAPFSVARVQDQGRNGFMARLRATEGVSVIASPQRMEMLGKYCKEHLGGDIRVLEKRDTQTFSVHTITCGGLG
jgi:hypothetical protein